MLRLTGENGGHGGWSREQIRHGGRFDVAWPDWGVRVRFAGVLVLRARRDATARRASVSSGVASAGAVRACACVDATRTTEHDASTVVHMARRVTVSGFTNDYTDLTFSHTKAGARGGRAALGRF